VRPAMRVLEKYEKPQKLLPKPPTFGRCGDRGKVKYQTHKHGQMQLEIISLTNPVLAKDLHTYKCPKCHFIHLGHHNNLPAFSALRRKRLKEISQIWCLEYTPKKGKSIKRVIKFVVRAFFKELAEVLDRTAMDLVKDGED
jgi:hypothetical protein